MAQWAYGCLRISATIHVDIEEEKGRPGPRKSGQPKRWRVKDLQARALAKEETIKRWRVKDLQVRALAEEETIEETMDSYLGKVRIVMRKDRAAGERESRIGGVVSKHVVRDATDADDMSAGIDRSKEGGKDAKRATLPDR